MRPITVALAGNPNSGKTSIFNGLTGTRQHVGNYPGVTVEKKEGSRVHGDLAINVVDLPGAYSLTAYAVDELVARSFIMDEKPDVVVDIVDASNLERNLYLTTQILELGARVIIVLNMSDLAKARGIVIDVELLSRLLGCRVVTTVGNRSQGITELLEAIAEVASEEERPAPVHIGYGRDVERRLQALAPLVEKHERDLVEEYGARWLAIKLLEHDDDIRKKIRSQEVLDAAAVSSAELARHSGNPPEILIAEARYGFISGVAQETVRAGVEVRHDLSDKMDSVLLNRVLALPIFLILMYLVFNLTFTLGEPVMGWIEALFGWLGATISGWWRPGSESALRSLLVDGVIRGVGGVVVFLPNILLLFLAIAILEDSGYMARAAFIMDRLMHKIGLHGKSFIPMVIGFGCTVPAIMATRTLDSRRDRLVTMMITPLMSCAARLPIYALIIPAFFPTPARGPMLWTMYVIGIVLAIICAKVLRATIFPGPTAPLVMELPPYHVPMVSGVLLHMWERGWLYLKKAGTVILAVSIVLWAMTSFPKKTLYDRDYAARTADAGKAFDRGVMRLNAELGLPADSTALLNLLRSPQRRVPGTDERPAIETPGPYPEPAALEEFQKVTAAVRAARNAFGQAAAEPRTQEGLGRYAVTRERRDWALAKLAQASPRVYAAALRYLDHVKAPFDEKLAEIARAKQSEDMAYSVAGRIGRGLEPILRPLGFDWRIGTALIGAFAAKEVFVAQMGIVYSVGEADEESDALRAKLRRNYSPLQGFCIMLFCLISAPCVATIATTRREANSWAWALFQLAGLTLLAYVVTLFVYQLGSLLKIGVG